MDLCVNVVCTAITLLNTSCLLALKNLITFYIASDMDHNRNWNSVEWKDARSLKIFHGWL